MLISLSFQNARLKLPKIVVGYNRPSVKNHAKAIKKIHHGIDSENTRE
jgi:hypothetical protein